MKWYYIRSKIIVSTLVIKAKNQTLDTEKLPLETLEGNQTWADLIAWSFIEFVFIVC